MNRTQAKVTLETAIEFNWANQDLIDKISDVLVALDKSPDGKRGIETLLFMAGMAFGLAGKQPSQIKEALETVAMGWALGVVGPEVLGDRRVH